MAPQDLVRPRRRESPAPGTPLGELLGDPPWPLCRALERVGQHGVLERGWALPAPAAGARGARAQAPPPPPPKALASTGRHRAARSPPPRQPRGRGPPWPPRAYLAAPTPSP